MPEWRTSHHLPGRIHDSSKSGDQEAPSTSCLKMRWPFSQLVFCPGTRFSEQRSILRQTRPRSHSVSRKTDWRKSTFMDCERHQPVARSGSSGTEAGQNGGSSTLPQLIQNLHDLSWRVDSSAPSDQPVPKSMLGGPAILFPMHDKRFNFSKTSWQKSS